MLLVLPRATRFTRQSSARAALRATVGFLRDPVMLATYAVGGAVLFSLVAAFTFVTYHLAGPPFGLGTLALGNVFAVYLLGVVVTPLAGRLVDRVGHRLALLAALATSMAGLLLTLIPAVAAIVLGLGARLDRRLRGPERPRRASSASSRTSAARPPPRSTSPSTTPAAASGRCCRQPSGPAAAGPPRSASSSRCRRSRRCSPPPSGRAGPSRARFSRPSRTAGA